MSYLWYWPAGGWDFDTWKARHPWQPLTGPQSGNPHLAPLVPRGSGRQDWERHRAGWLEITHALLGTLTDQPPADVSGETLETRETPSYSARRLRYRLTAEEWGYAWLTIPREVRGPLPAMIALHQTVPQGKEEPMGLNGDPALAYGRELAEQGYVVLAPDAIGFGERQKDHPNAFYRSADAFFARHPHGSVLAKMAYDTQRAVDLLAQMPEVDQSRIGCIGHSHGGYGTLFAMLLDPRIQAGVISCGVSMLRSDPTPERWWRKTALLPRLGYYEGRITQTPLDFHHWLALLAPRPLMLVAALNDAIFPNTVNLRDVARDLRRVYQLYDAPHAFHHWIFQGGHRFPRAARAAAYRLLPQALWPDSAM